MLNDFKSAIRPALAMTLLFAALLGLAYPFAVTGIGQMLFPHQANGSLVRDGNRAIGSEIVGQAFTSAGYFQSRPSAAGAGYDGLASSGSNLGLTSQALAERVATEVATRRSEGVAGAMPADLVTASGSGLDPDLSPEAAMAQAPRVAQARGLPLAQVQALVRRNIDRPVIAFLGEPHVNLLALNRQLDMLASGRGR